MRPFAEVFVVEFSDQGQNLLAHGMDEKQAKVIGSNMILLSEGDPTRLNIHRAMQAFEPYLAANRRTENPINRP